MSPLHNAKCQYVCVIIVFSAMDGCMMEKLLEVHYEEIDLQFAIFVMWSQKVTSTYVHKRV